MTVRIYSSIAVYCTIQYTAWPVCSLVLIIECDHSFFEKSNQGNYYLKYFYKFCFLFYVILLIQLQLKPITESVSQKWISGDCTLQLQCTQHRMTQKRANYACNAWHKYSAKTSKSLYFLFWCINLPYNLYVMILYIIGFTAITILDN